MDTSLEPPNKIITPKSIRTEKPPKMKSVIHRSLLKNKLLALMLVSIAFFSTQLAAQEQPGKAAGIPVPQGLANPKVGESAQNGQDDSGTKKKMARDYVKGAVLTPAQEKTVLELAKQRGLKKVAKIYTYYLQPTQARGIGVIEEAKIKGRDVSYMALEVRYKNWWHPNASPGKGDIKIGDFWAGKPRAEKHKILKVNMKKIWVRSINGLQVDQCEQILQQLMAKKFVLEPGVNKETMQQVDLTRPKSFSKRGEEVAIDFQHKTSDSEFFSLQIKPSKEQLSITQLLHAIF